MEDKRVYSGAPWEKTVSYCRAICKGTQVAVSGTTSIENGAVFARGDHYAQAKKCLQIIEDSLRELGLTRNDVIRTRMFVTDISKWELYGQAHGEFFIDSPPATAMYEIKSLINPELLIEIEADAVVPLEKA